MTNLLSVRLGWCGGDCPPGMVAAMMLLPSSFLVERRRVCWREDRGEDLRLDRSSVGEDEDADAEPRHTT